MSKAPKNKKGKESAKSLIEDGIVDVTTGIIGMGMGGFYSMMGQEAEEQSTPAADFALGTGEYETRPRIDQKLGLVGGLLKIGKGIRKGIFGDEIEEEKVEQVTENEPVETPVGKKSNKPETDKELSEEEIVERYAEVQKEITDKITDLKNETLPDGTKKMNEKGDIKCTGHKEAEEICANFKNAYEALGIPCEITRDETGMKYGINPQIPQSFIDKKTKDGAQMTHPFSMNPEELKELQEAIKEQEKEKMKELAGDVVNDLKEGGKVNGDEKSTDQKGIVNQQESKDIVR